MTFPAAGLHNLRTDETFRDRIDQSHHKYQSPFEAIEDLTDMIFDFPIDPMHLVYHGIVKRF